MIESFSAFVLAAQITATVLQSAVGMLPQVGYKESTLPQIVLVDHKAGAMTDNTEGFTQGNDGKVYVTTFSKTYQSAMRGDSDAVKKLASVIAHEACHVKNGPDERAAYETQLQVLQKLHASPEMINGVQRAMKSVVSTKNSTR